MRSLLVLLLLPVIAIRGNAAEPTARDVVAQLYQAAESKHNDPFEENKLLSRYFDSTLLQLYLRDVREAKGEVGRLEVDPLYNAQEMEITNLNISPPETTGTETRVNVRFKNLGKPTLVLFLLTHTSVGWRISDIRYDDGSSLKKILQAPL